MYSATRWHEISVGHRVAGHESKCSHLHGHNLKIHFTCEAGPPPKFIGEALYTPEKQLDDVGRVVDFADIKARLCQWLEGHWDHKMLIWEHDDMLGPLRDIDPQGVRPVSFNPTAENMARYLAEVVGPMELEGTGVRLVAVTVEETRKCCATFEVNS